MRDLIDAPVGYQGKVVYFIGADWSSPIKIGYTTLPRLKARLSAIQIGHPHRLRVLRAVIGGHALEQSLHERFADERLNGEWFSPSAELRDAAGETPPDLPRVVVIRGRVVSRHGVPV